MHPFFRLGLCLLGLLLGLAPVFGAAPVFQRSDAVAVSLGQSVDYRIVAVGDVTAYGAQNLPNGVKVDAATGRISGTPTDVGTYLATISAANGDGMTTARLAISVVAPDAAPLIYAPLTFDAYCTPQQGGDMFSCALKATGNPSGFQLTGTLPSGWSFSGGTVVGRTTTPGLFLVPVSATNPYGSGSAAVTVRVHPACSSLTQTTGTLKAGDVFTVTLQLNRAVSFSGTAPYLEFHTYPDGTTRRIPYASGNGTATFVFSTTITAEDAPGDILLYTSMQPALGSGVSGLVDDNGLELGTALPISVQSGPLASIAASAPVAPSPAAGTVATQGAGSGAVASSASPTPTGSTTPATSGAATTPTGSTTPVAAPAPAPTQVVTAAASTPSSGGRLVNLSARGLVSDGDSGRAFIAGFVVSGTAPKRMLLRAVGPALAPFGVQNPLANPQLRVFDATGHAVGESDDWSGSETASTSAAVGAFSLPAGGRDAALAVTLNPGSYSMQVLPNGGNGVALAEIYDADAAGAGAPLINISTRGFVGTGEGVLTAGFVVGGDAPKRLLIRGVGAALAGFGVAGVLSNPTVKVYRENTLVAQNDDWENQTEASAADVAAAAKAVGAFDLPKGSRDAAAIVTLAPGAYSAAVSGSGGATGAAMVEVYELDR